MISSLCQFIRSHPKLVVLTGAGVSTASGIPAYRDQLGQWQTGTPIQHQDFIDVPFQRQRYWARSAIGWPLMAKARPNAAHHALVAMERAGYVSLLVTQNVDRLHQRAGQQNVVDLHGRLDRAFCLQCGQVEQRESIQQRLLTANPFLYQQTGRAKADGDAAISETQIDRLVLPECLICNGILKPDVVFFGGCVVRQRVAQISQAIIAADAFLVVGSSLAVYSGFRFCKLAHQQGIPIAAVNLGQTRADNLLSLKVNAETGDTLTRITKHFGLRIQQ